MHAWRKVRQCLICMCGGINFGYIETGPFQVAVGVEKLNKTTIMEEKKILERGSVDKW